MQLTIIIPAVLALSTGAQAWLQDEQGVWVAHATIHDLDGMKVAEACTHKDTNDIRMGLECAYWADGSGNIIRGYCASSESSTGSKQILCQ